LDRASRLSKATSAFASRLPHRCTAGVQVSSEALRKACPIPFHEGRLWKSADAADLKRQLQTHFQNITSIMDCVGCEKCKLWGKLQLLGAGIFDHADAAVAPFHVWSRPSLSISKRLEHAQSDCTDGHSQCVVAPMSDMKCLDLRRHRYIFENLVP